MRGLCLLALLGLGACASPTLHPVGTETQYVDAAELESCEAGEALLEQRGAWQIPFFFGPLVDPRPNDELWVIDVVPEYSPPFGERAGFVLVIECDEREHSVSLRECPLEGGRRLWADPRGLGELGELERGCVLHLRLRDEATDEEWYAIDCVMLRDDLREWVAPITRSDASASEP